MLKRFLSSSPGFHFVPKHTSPSPRDIQILQQFVSNNSKLFVLTGAGVSTESGIPDYRSAEVGVYARTTYRPMTLQEFLSSEAARKRYWSRNFIGWPQFSSLQPNQAHLTIKKWQDRNKVHCLVTQNVDSLHNKAGSNAIELHGTGYNVICLQCHYQVSRTEFQDTLLHLNPPFAARITPDQIRPDGNIDVNSEEIETFVIPPCPSCSGILKPEIVFFGDNVKRSKVDKLYGLLQESDCLMVLGSSLEVFSSLRFALRAKEIGIPISIITLGQTRADHFAKLKLLARVGEILPLIEV